MMKRGTKLFGLLVAAVVVVALSVSIRGKLSEQAAAGASAPGDGGGPVAVEVAPIVRGEIARLRTFSGALEATAEFEVAPKLSGRIRELTVDLADTVQRGQVVARLDDAEYVQAIQQATAELEVARANETEAESALEIAGRSMARIVSLQERGVSSESQLDTSRAEQLAAEARLAVSRAHIARTQAALETARIRRSYTDVTADWTGGDDERVVAWRQVDEGDTASANQPLMTSVEIDPLLAIFHVPERDYATLRREQPVTLTTQAFPGEHFEGRIARIAPVFREVNRQARVEVSVPNDDGRLKPGMFVRVTVELERDTQAVIVPAAALTSRDDQDGLFVVSADGRTALWRAVEIGIEQDTRVSVRGEGLVGNVVTLGQQLLDDGSPIRVHQGERDETAGDDQPLAEGAPAEAVLD
jgi:RND family efflux transporter MFP subunit